jgi:hypothetical protein
MARSASKKHTPKRVNATPLPEAVVEARAVALGLPRFAVRLMGTAQCRPNPAPWPRRACE